MRGITYPSYEVDVGRGKGLVASTLLVGLVRRHARGSGDGYEAVGRDERDVRDVRDVRSYCG